MLPHTECHTEGNWHTHRDNAKSACSRGSQQGLRITGAVCSLRQTLEGRAQDLQTPFRSGMDSYSLYISETLQTLYFTRRNNQWEERETEQSGVGFHPKGQVSILSYSFSSAGNVIHYFTLGFSVSWKVFFFLPLQLFSKILRSRVVCLVFFLFLFVGSFVLRSPWFPDLSNSNESLLLFDF